MTVGVIDMTDEPSLVKESTAIKTGVVEDEANNNDKTNNEWLGNEPKLFDIDMEIQGVQDILSGLTKEEHDQVEKHDKTMPIRYFRAEKGNVTKAIERLQKTLKWREEFGIQNIIKCMHPEPGQELTDEQLELRKTIIAEINTGYLYVRGYDQHGRAIINIHPTVTKTGNLDGEYMAIFYQMERAIACTKRKSNELGNKKNDNSLEKFIVASDYTGFGSKHRTPLCQIQRIFTNFTDHYPERLQSSNVYNPTLVMRAVYALAKPFMDADTRKKVAFFKYQDDIQPFINTLNEENKNKIEKCFLQIPNNDDDDIRPFDPTEYINLPFNVAFDE